MLVLSNGVIKSGSTWLTHIVRELVQYEPIPDQYHNTAKWSGLSIHPDLLKNFLEEVDCGAVNYVSKNHLNRARDYQCVLKSASVLVLDIRRDIADVLWSDYCSETRQGTLSVSFEKYYKYEGRYLAARIEAYHKLWSQLPAEKFYMSSFERLKNDFQAEVVRLADFLKIEVDEAEVARIQEVTSLERFRKKWKEDEKPEAERFFRKGAIGDGKGQFSEEMMEDLQSITDGGMLPWGQLQGKLLRRLVRY